MKNNKNEFYTPNEEGKHLSTYNKNKENGHSGKTRYIKRPINNRKNEEFYTPDKDGNYFIPLSGTQEVGCNANIALCVHEGKKEQIIVDAGLGMLNEFGGVEQCIPDFYVIDPNITTGVVITHAHLDHFGALIYLLKRLNKGTPVYATALTISVIRNQLKGKRIEANLITVDLNSEFNIGELFHVQLINVTHSIPETQMITITYKRNNLKLFHTADFKLDEDPVAGEITNFELLKKIGDEGVTCMISDSTNANNEEWSKTEKSVQEELLKLIKTMPNKKVIVTSFSSNLARLKSMMIVASKTNRKILFLGTAMYNMLSFPASLVYLSGYEHLFAHNYENIKENELLIICTGSQGENKATLSKLAKNGNINLNEMLQNLVRNGNSFAQVIVNKLPKTNLSSLLRMHPQDKVKTAIIFSSKVIPGNEIKISNLKSQLIKKGGEIYDTDGHKSIHASGHPGQPESLKIVEYIRPKYIIPVHGTPFLIQKAAKLFNEAGIPCIVPYNGCIIELMQNECKIIGDLKIRSRGLDGDKKLVVDLLSRTMENRKTLGEHGVIIAIYSTNNIPNMQIISEGALPNNTLKSDEFKKIIKNFQDYVAKVAELEAQKTYLQNSIYSRYGKSPLIVIHTT